MLKREQVGFLLSKRKSVGKSMLKAEADRFLNVESGSSLGSSMDFMMKTEAGRFLKKTEARRTRPVSVFEIKFSVCVRFQNRLAGQPPFEFQTPSLLPFSRSSQRPVSIWNSLPSLPGLLVPWSPLRGVFPSTTVSFSFFQQLRRASAGRPFASARARLLCIHTNK